MTGATAPFTIGTEVSCTDGDCGSLIRVVVDPVARALTHLVVGPRHRWTAGHLVPVALVDPAAPPIRLNCTTAEFAALPSAEEEHFLPGFDNEWGYETGDILAWPYYGAGLGTGIGGTVAMEPLPTDPGPSAIMRDRVPVGEVEIVRGEPVHATDGAIGRVQGLVVDSADHHVTHVLLDEGHLWGRRRVAIPIGAVAGVAGEVRLSLTKDEVRDLPPVDLAG
ncbi:PRC-barrel domain-containing protein [Streptomyces sp. NBC_01476]|uniref:PRC-barrel domain-containing protein n=1 Tax=Streptomyces sp. NBC_01476 TaxID=2903881 RepID=UPI002E2EC04F|nr:PRC-barrel domain-containing protein [Streptomyces sp. NBC_01476]